MRWLIPMFLAVTACGDGMKDSTFEGVPLFSFTGVLLENPTFERQDPTPLRFALFWRTVENQRLADKIFEATQTSQDFNPPGRFTINLHRTPDAVVPLEQAVGFLLIYADKNGNGVRDPDEEVVGDAPEAVVLYASRRLTGAESVTGAPLNAGFQVAGAPLLCGLAPPSGPTEGCAIEIGQPCFADSNCREGATCVESVFASRLPGGMCIVINDSVDAEANRSVDPGTRCASQANYVPIMGGSWFRELGVAVEGVWMPSCRTDQDCGRPGYDCAPGIQICLPTPAFGITQSSGRDATPHCLADFAILGRE